MEGISNKITDGEVLDRNFRATIAATALGTAQKDEAAWKSYQVSRRLLRFKK